MGVLASVVLRWVGLDAKSRQQPVTGLNRWGETLFAAAMLLVLMGAAFFLIGFALWSEVLIRFQEIQSFIGHSM